MLKEAAWRDRQKISVLVELTAFQKNVTNALNSVGIILKNKVLFVAFLFFYMVELQNFLNAPRTWPHDSFQVIRLSMTLGIFQGHWTVSHQISQKRCVIRQKLL